jgi:hypothetical protein
LELNNKKIQRLWHEERRERLLAARLSQQIIDHLASNLRKGLCDRLTHQREGIGISASAPLAGSGVGPPRIRDPSSVVGSVQT